jgi:oligo-1,6-glucosidase
LIRLVDKSQQSVDYPINYLETGAEANYVKFFGSDKQNCLRFAKLLTGLNFSLKGLPFISEGETIEDNNAETDPTSLYNFTAKMIEFRKNSKALSEGVYHRVASQNDVYIFTREAKEERLYLYSNFTPYNKNVEFYGDRIVFSNYDVDGLEAFYLKPYEFRIVASNI